MPIPGYKKTARTMGTGGKTKMKLVRMGSEYTTF